MIAPIQTTGPPDPLTGAAPAASPVPRASFGDELARATQQSGSIRFSAHAEKRLSDRNIALSDTDRARIAQSADLAASKGAREALLLMDRLALVVGVPSRTVITVMEPQNGSPAVFTQIDSVVMVPREGA
jgi:flagellar operon protein